MFAQRHFHEYGTTREQMAWIALNARRNAALNPKAIYTAPMTMDDYIAARMISTPFCLYDCDVPCDGGTAVIVSRDRPRQGSAQAAVAGRGGRLRDPRSAVVGPVRRPLDDGEPRRRRADVDAHRPEAERRAAARGVRRLLVHHDVVDRGARLLQGGGERSVHRRRHAHRARRASCRSTRTAASSRPVACTATASCTRPRRRCGARAATARSRGCPEIAVAAAGGGNTCGCLLLVRD